jgi:hypothetical protein
MRREPYDQQVITEYLLGTLSAAESERFDELSFTDESFIEARNAIENDLIDAYVNEEIESALLDQFESHYLASPLKREKVDLARAFLESANCIAPQIADAGFKESTSRASLRQSWVQLLGARPWRTASALLASIILVGIVWLVIENSRRVRDSNNQTARDESASQQTPERLIQTNQPDAEKPPASPEPTKKDGEQERSKPRLATIVLSPQLRSATETPVVTLSTNTEYLGIRLELEPNNYSVYKVLLLDQTNGQVLWRSNRVNGQNTADGKVLNLRLPAELLKSRSYVLQVSGLSERRVEETISDYPFRVVK